MEKRIVAILSWALKTPRRALGVMFALLVANTLVQDDIIGWPRPPHLWVGIGLMAILTFMIGFFCAFAFLGAWHERNRR